MKVFGNIKRPGVTGRHPLPGSALANHTFDGFGAKAFIQVPESEETESDDMKEFFPDDDSEKD